MHHYAYNCYRNNGNAFLIRVSKSDQGYPSKIEQTTAKLHTHATLCCSTYCSFPFVCCKHAYYWCMLQHSTILRNNSINIAINIFPYDNRFSCTDSELQVCLFSFQIETQPHIINLHVRRLHWIKYYSHPAHVPLSLFWVLTPYTMTYRKSRRIHAINFHVK